MASYIARAFRENGISIVEVYLFLGVIIAVIAATWTLAKITDTRGSAVFLPDTQDWLRGGCLIILLGGGGLVFVAALVWAWRYIFN